ncbi:family 43 glycosylhydrolase [Specibacter sp. NPDC057265]|uniref:family 43 glycosylhydrolase n=1 Tax=Specibacter sp. NPDC057265 TaxID=3346075 RepID=UPI003644C307
MAAVGVVLSAALAPLTAPANAADAWIPAPSLTTTDRGDGTYSVPLFNADVPDVSVERVPAAENGEGRDTYYMISTTMHLSPGAPIMKSYDLVNWEIVNYVFDRLSIEDSASLRNNKESYGQGQWAASLRHHNGKFYVVFNTNNLGGAYIYSTDDIDNGAWTRTALGRGLHDPSLFFDDANGGTPYIFHGGGRTSASQLNENLTQIVADYPDIMTKDDFPQSYVTDAYEGQQIYRIGDYYYNVTITWPPGGGRQVVMFRSKDLLGRYSSTSGANTYEAKRVLDSNGWAQGSLVPIAKDDGTTSWHGMFFRDSWPSGRIPALIPAVWTDGWPTFGNNGDVDVNGTFPKPIRLSAAEEQLQRQRSIVASDGFSNDAPHKAYMDEQWTLPSPANIDQSLINVELLQNPGFESGSVQPWAGQFGANLSLETGDKAAGAASLKVADRTLNGSAPYQLLNGKVQAGVTYAVSAKVKYDSGPDTIRFNLVSDYGQDVKEMASAIATRGQWTTVTGAYTIPQNTDVSNFKLAVETPWGNPQPASSTVEYLLDDVSFIGQPSTLEQPTAAEIVPNGSRLRMEWEWNHAPDNRYWSLTARDGWLRLTAGKVVTGNSVFAKKSANDELTWFEEARNTLSQRTWGPKASAETSIDISGMKDGDVAGLAQYTRQFSYVAVKRVNGQNTIGVVQRLQPFTAAIDQASVEAFVPGTTANLGAATQVHLKADADFSTPGQLSMRYYYSIDGQNWVRLGDRFGPMSGTDGLAHFMGQRFGLFNYATEQAGGHADFDYYLLSSTLTDENKPLDPTGLDAAITQAQSLKQAEYPAQAWAAMETELAKAKTAKSNGFGTQNQIDAPVTELNLRLSELAVIKAASRPLAVPAVVGTRCLGGKVLVTVQATNGESVPVSVSVSSAYGSKAFASVAPGKNVAHAFTTRARSVPAGTVTVEASASINGSPVTTSVQAGYDAKTCN